MNKTKIMIAALLLVSAGTAPALAGGLGVGLNAGVGAGNAVGANVGLGASMQAGEPNRTRARPPVDGSAAATAETRGQAAAAIRPLGRMPAGASGSVAADAAAGAQAR